MICDRVVVGIYRTEVKDRLLREATLTLEGAMSICRADEESRKRLDLMKKEAIVSTLKQKHGESGQRPEYKKDKGVRDGAKFPENA